MDNSNSPLISIIVASYNYAHLIKETIDSVLAQTYQNWELIIVDDGSQDNSIDIIKQYQDKRIHLYEHPNHANLGLIATIRHGLHHCSGDWIAFLEADDYWDIHCLQARVDIVKDSPKIALLFNEVQCFGNESMIQKFHHFYRYRDQYLQDGLQPSKFWYYFLFINPIATFSSVMIKKELLYDIDFQSPVAAWTDWYIYLQLALKDDYRFYYLPQRLTFWRHHGDSYIARNCTTVSNANSKKLLSNFLNAIYDMLEKDHYAKLPQMWRIWRFALQCPFTKSIAKKLIYQQLK